MSTCRDVFLFAVSGTAAGIAEPDQPDIVKRCILFSMVVQYEVCIYREVLDFLDPCDVPRGIPGQQEFPLVFIDIQRMITRLPGQDKDMCVSPYHG